MGYQELDVTETTQESPNRPDRSASDTFPCTLLIPSFVASVSSPEEPLAQSSRSSVPCFENRVVILETAPTQKWF